MVLVLALGTATLAASGSVSAAPAARAGCGPTAPGADFAGAIARDERAGQIWRLYAAYFQRQPDLAGFDHWRSEYDRLGGEAISNFFAGSPEFSARFGRLSDADFVELVYEHVLCRRPDRDGRDFWVRELRKGFSRGGLMLSFSDSPEFRQRTASVPNPARLVFVEDFNGDSSGGAGLDPNTWRVGAGTLGAHNGELQCFRQENVRISDGILRLTARDQPVNCDAGRRQYTSGYITTEGKQSWRYGRFEVRARFPAEFGLWPAVWMLPTDRVFGAWPNSGELDIVETIGRSPDHVVGTAHWLSPQGTELANGWHVGGGEYIAEWHTYTLEWTPNRLTWSVDGITYHEVRDWVSAVGGDGAPFNQRFHLALSLAVGGTWPQAPNETTELPATMEVDWVRIYER